MIREPEDIQNRVRNALGPIQTLHDVVDQIIGLDADDKKSIKLYNWLVKSNLVEYVQESINKLIILAKAADMKIDDKMFCIEDFIKENNLNTYETNNTRIDITNS